MSDQPVVALTIAGVDSGGGAGIAADLKAFARCGVHGTCAVTAVTAQNTVAVDVVYPMPPELVLAQVRAVVCDLGVAAVKVGMLANAAVAEAVADALAELDGDVPVVVDPVLLSSTGAQLLDAAGQRVLIERILPRATVVTPNRPEAELLATVAGQFAEIGTMDTRDLIVDLLGTGAGAVVITGGHGLVPGLPGAGADGGGQPGSDPPEAEIVDLFTSRERPSDTVPIGGPRVTGAASHGSGCTHSAVLAARLALGAAPLAAARDAQLATRVAIANGHPGLGAGTGPVDVLGVKALGAQGFAGNQRPAG
jgi:hydroxymethylpyrimidine/phosphomethylpyrimidine kinase